jgi:hypothetical protein
MDTKETANLGLATTDDLFDELVCRLGRSFSSEIGEIPAVDRAVKLTAVQYSLPLNVRQYRTVDGER